MNEETTNRKIATIPQWCLEAASAILEADPCMCKGNHAEKVEHLGAKYAAIIEEYAGMSEPGLSPAAMLMKLENREDLLHAALSYIGREIQGY